MVKARTLIDRPAIKSFDVRPPILFVKRLTITGVPDIETPPPLVPPGFIRRRYADTLAPENMLALETLFTLRAGVQALDNAVIRLLGNDALTPGRWQILVVLWSQDAPVPQREIVIALKVSRANVSTLVDALAREGHLTTLSDPTDGRQVLVALTQAGRRMMERLVHDTAAKLRRSFALTDDELRQLIALVSRLLA